MHSISPVELFQSFRKHRYLILSLSKREILSRYRGSLFGILWSFFNPIFMLTIYTFVFSVVFKAKWGTGSESRAEFAMVLFAALIVFTFFSECINRAPSIIIGNVNYVKKVVFPIEILPYTVLISGLFHMGISVLVWICAYTFLIGIPHYTIIFLPLIIIPLIMLTIGLVWFISALGVYLRDISQITGILTSTLLFMSPIFYPISILPETYQKFLFFNPLTLAIEQTRNVMYWGTYPDWVNLGLYYLGTALIAWLGFTWFQKTRKGFADVL